MSDLHRSEANIPSRNKEDVIEELAVRCITHLAFIINGNK